MSNKDKPNYYAILPAEIRYSKKINPLERLLYAEITCLVNYKGHCWATNRYFGKIFDRHPSSISRNLSKLALHNFIKIKLVRNNNNVEERIITLVNTPQQNCEPPLNKNVKYNNKKEKDMLFEEFWNNYNFKKSRKLCYAKFMSFSTAICRKCVTAAKVYSESITDDTYKKHPGTWLNQGCWDDEIQDKNKNDFKGSKYDGFVF